MSEASGAGRPALAQRWRRLVPLILAGAVAVAVPAAASSSPAGEARALARSMLSALRLPAGARPLASLPATLNHPFETIGPTQVVEVTERRVVEGTTPKALRAEIAARPPAHTAPSGEGTASGRSGVTVWAVTFSPTKVTAAIARAELVVSIARVRGGAALRADAEVSWWQPHPAVLSVASSVRRAVLSRTAQGMSTRRVVVSRGRELRRIVGAFDALPVAVPGARAKSADSSSRSGVIASCPLDRGARLQVAFPAASSSVEVTAVESNCDLVDAEAAGRSTVLSDDASGHAERFAGLVARALGYRSADQAWSG